MGHEEKEQQEVAANGVDVRFGDIENGGKILEDHGGEEREEEEEEDDDDEERERHLRRQNLEEESKGKGDQVDAKKKNPGLPGVQEFGKEPPSFRTSMKKLWSNKLQKQPQEEGKSWEEIGDEDLIGDMHGCCLPKKIFWKGSLDSQGCPTASSAQVKDIFRHCILVLGAYGTDMDSLEKAIKEHDPSFNAQNVVAFEHPLEPGGCPPYFVHVDHELKEVGMYIRGLNLLHHQDYITLMNNRKGEKPFDGGYIHHGMSVPVEWSIKHVAPVLKHHLLANQGYGLTIVGHSLGAGVAALLTTELVKHPEEVGGIDAERIRAIVFAPPRVMSLDLAIKYSPHVNSVIYQDDFLPRVSTQSMKRLFLMTFALTGPVVFVFWVIQALRSSYAEDVRRLYPPGKIYHFVYKQPGRLGHRPLRARVVPSARGRFERLVLSSSGTTSNHFVLTLCNHLKTYNWPGQLKDSWLTGVLNTKHT